MGDENQNAQPMVIGPMGQPVYPTVAVTSPSSTTTRVKPTKGYMQSIEDQKAAAQAEEDAINYGVNVDTNIAAAQKGIFDSALVAEQARIKARADAMASWNTRIGEARKQLDERIQQASAEPTSYWADRTEGERTQARIGSWLSAFGAAITGGDNLALKKISENIERDIKVKQAKSERLFKLAEQSRGLLSDSYRAKAEELGDMDAQRAAAWQVVAKQMESVKLGFLPAEKRAEADQKIALVQQKAAENLQNAHEKLADKVASESGHTTTTTPLGGKNERPTPSIDVQNFSRMEALGEIAARQQELMSDPDAIPTAAMQREYEQNENILINRAEKEQEGGAPSVMWSNFLRWLPDWMPGHVPSQAYPKNANAKQREWLDNDAVLGHFRAQQLGGQTAVANPRTLHTLMAPAKGMGGEDRPDAIRKSKLQSKEFQDQAKRAEEVSRVGEKEARLHPGATAPKPAASARGSAADDYSFIVNKLNRDPDALSPDRLEAFHQAIEFQKKGDPRAARAFRYIRDELPKD